MISGKMLAEQLEKFLKSPVCQNARVQVKLMQNNVLGHSETHWIVFELYPSDMAWKMGKPKKIIG